jgi:hypothetical protein
MTVAAWPRVSAVAATLALGLGCQRGSKGGASDARAGVVVVVDSDGGAPSGPRTPEKEPNDQIAQATALAVGSVAEGRIDKPRDVDVYKIVVPAPDRQTLSASLTGIPNVDLSLELADQSGARVLAINDGHAGEGETLSAVVVSPGSWYLRVRDVPARGAAPAASAQAYYLSWKLAPVDAAAEQEPNDKAALATPLGIGQPLSGQLAWRHDEDFFRVALQAGHNTADGGTAPAAPPAALRVDIGGLDDVALTVQVLDSIGAKLLERKGAKGEPVTLRNVGVKASEPFYLVVVRGSDRNLLGRYSIRVDAEQALGGPTEQEPNDDKSHATPVEPGTAISGFLGPSDQDFYRLRLTAPQIVRVELSCPERLNIKIAVHDASGAELWHVDEGGRQEPETITDAWLPAGDSYLRVYGGRGESNVDSPYRMEVRASPDDGSWEHEPNNSAARATVWPAGAPLMRGMIHPRGDEDWFRVPPPPADKSGLSATIRPLERVNIALALVDDQRQIVARAQGAGDADRVLRAPIDPARTYYLVVRDEKGRQSNPRDAYELHLAFE